MSKYICVILGCLYLIASGTLPTTAKPTEDGAFLVQPATTTSQLIDQVEGNRLVALRYAKHFQTAPSSVLTFFRNQLIVTELTQDLTLTEYYLDESRSIATRTITLKVGQKVFANKAGMPILSLGSGNPLCDTLTTSAIPQKSSALSATTKATTNDIVTQVLATPPTEFNAGGNAGEAARLESAVNGTLIAANTPSAGPAIKAGQSSAGTGLSSFLLPVGIIGAAAAFAGGGGGGSDATVTTTPVDNNIQVIPEPAGMLSLAAGLSGMFGLIYRKKMLK